jgi:hypothetical protein
MTRTRVPPVLVTGATGRLGRVTGDLTARIARRRTARCQCFSSSGAVDVSQAVIVLAVWTCGLIVGSALLTRIRDIT